MLPVVVVKSVGSDFVSVWVEFMACPGAPEHLGLLVKDWTVDICDPNDACERRLLW
jgi:hypothetical protein